MNGLFPVSTEDIVVASTSDFVSTLESAEKDFVLLFPPELTNKLFTYVSDRDAFTCAKCSIQWRKALNNNSQWKLRCIRRGWYYKEGGVNDSNKWSNMESYMGDADLQFRASPRFHLPPVASLRIGPLCDWAKYFRQCYHLECNWKEGRYVVRKLRVPEQVYPAVYNTCDCNGKLFAAGTTTGYLLVWSVSGPPSLVACILAVRKRIEVELIQLTETHMIVVCQTGLLQCYSINGVESCGKIEPFELIFQYRIGGTFVNDHTYAFQVEQLTAEQVENMYHLRNRIEDDILMWVRELFRDTPWMENDYMVCDIFFSIRQEKIILSGISANSVQIWDIPTGRWLKAIQLPANTQICSKTVVRSNKIYLSTRRVIDNHGNSTTFHLLIYDLDEVLEGQVTTHKEFHSFAMLEEVNADAADNRVAWVAQDSLIIGKELNSQETLFVHNGISYVDNLTLYQDLIIYHQYDGFVVAIDWNGVIQYEIEVRIGIVRRLSCIYQFLVSGGDAKNLSVWDNRTGEMYHRVHHQPCRIEHMFTDETKVITLGREDPPVLVGYW